MLQDLKSRIFPDAKKEIVLKNPSMRSEAHGMATELPDPAASSTCSYTVHYSVEGGLTLQHYNATTLTTLNILNPKVKNKQQPKNIKRGNEDVGARGLQWLENYARTAGGSGPMKMHTFPFIHIKVLFSKNSGRKQVLNKALC